MYRRLYILIEGSDGGNFFNGIIKPLFEKKYDWVNIVPHAQKPPKITRQFINCINSMSSDNLVADYIFVTDINDAPCITHRKQTTQNKISNIDKDKIMIIRKEIEGWYLAGLDNACCKKCRIPTFNATENITKEQFNSLMPKKYEGSRIDFLQEILKYFQVEIAKQKNESFRYFLEDFYRKYAPS